MAGTLISTFYNGDSTNNSLTAIQQTLLRIYRAHDGMTFGNFVKNNTSMLNVLAGSSVVVNMNFYQWSVTDSILLLNADGSTASINSAGAAEYYIIAVINADKTLSIYARLASAVTVTGNPNYCGWYITNTQHRVLGGVTKLSDGTYGRKWRYKPYNFTNVNPDNLDNREYADGLTTNLNVCTTAKNVYTMSVLTGFATAASVTTDITITHPCKLWLNIRGHSIFTHLGLKNTQPAAVSLFCDIIYLDSDDTELDVMQTTTVTFPARIEWSSAGPGETVTRNRILDVTPGKYRLKFYNGAYKAGNMVANYPETNTILAYTRDEICNTDTTY